MLRRLQRAVDFERVLRTRSRASSAHFAVHHLAGSPALRERSTLPVESATAPHLSTGVVAVAAEVVDGAPVPEPLTPPAIWFGAVVPKRHARRAVTRTLLKRQIRNVVAEGASGLASGLWVVRLRAPFDRAVFRSAASDPLRQQARTELQQVLAAAVERSRSR